MYALELIWTHAIAPLALVIGSVRLAIMLMDLVSLINRQFLRTKMDHL